MVVTHAKNTWAAHMCKKRESCPLQLTNHLSGSQKKEQRISPLRPALCPSPEAAGQLVLLVKRVQTHANVVGTRSGAVRFGADHGIFNRAEAAIAGLVDDQRYCSRVVLNVAGATGGYGEAIAALAC